MKVLVGALILAGTLLLAGCSGGGGKANHDGVGSASVSKGDGTESPPQPLPAWALGDYWTYTFNGVETTYVITGSTASDWIMETDSQERSFSDLRDDVSRLGAQRKSDLAGSQGNDRVEFFHWPLANGMADWSTTWDHQAVRVHVLGVNPGFAELEARLSNATATDPPLYKYVYDDTVGWFRELTHYAPDGSEVVNLKLTASGHNWTGRLARWTLTPIADLAGDLAQSPPPPGTYEVPLTATDVWVHAALHCTSGVVNIGTSPSPFVAAIAGQDDRGGGVAGQPCPQDDAFTGPAGAPEAPPQGGASETWGYSVTVSAGAGGTYEFEILVRTLELVPFGT